jgi:hypothetical protein
MPYVDDIRRKDKLDPLLGHQIRTMPEIETKGDLEYYVFLLMKKYMSTRASKYSNLHDTVYAIMHCADEFRRRYLDKREDDAREANGDV